MIGNIRSLIIDHKYTLVTFNFKGYPYQEHIYAFKLSCDSHDRYSEAYYLRYKRRKSVGKGGAIWLHEGKQFIIWEGWVNPDVQMAVASFYKDNNSGHVKLLKCYKPYNARYLQRAKLSIAQKPIVENINKTKIDDRMFDLCTIIS